MSSGLAHGRAQCHAWADPCSGTREVRGRGPFDRRLETSERETAAADRVHMHVAGKGGLSSIVLLQRTVVADLDVAFEDGRL